MNTFIKKLSLAALLASLNACVSYPAPYYASQPVYRSSYVVERGYYAHQPVYLGGYFIRRNYYGYPSHRPPYNHPPYYRPAPIIPHWREGGEEHHPHGHDGGRDGHRPSGHGGREDRRPHH